MGSGGLKQKSGDGRLPRRFLHLAVVMAVAAGVSGCGNKEKKSGQALASVNGMEITAMQLNEELGLSPNVPREVASKQFLDALIDRQLLQIEAARDKTDREPGVVQAIERAKAVIIAQAYLQKRVGPVEKPTQAEVENYYAKNPVFFAKRKQLELKQLVLASKDIDAPIKHAIDNAKSLDEMVEFLESRKISFGRSQVTRFTSDMPAEVTEKLVGSPKGQLFFVQEGERSLLMGVSEIKDASVTLDVASPQIAQYLMGEKQKAAATGELARLRAAAKIEYLNKDFAPAAASTGTETPAAKPVSSTDANERGVAGLK
jgi:peptidyl-prolyl cis-trans isomerase C